MVGTSELLAWAATVETSVTVSCCSWPVVVTLPDAVLAAALALEVALAEVLPVLGVEEAEPTEVDDWAEAPRALARRMKAVARRVMLPAGGLGCALGCERSRRMG